MTQEFINPSDGVVREYLATSKTLAVVGLSDREVAIKSFQLTLKLQVTRFWEKRLMLV